MLVELFEPKIVNLFFLTYFHSLSYPKCVEL